jgi:hypothetical protein
MGQEPDDLSDAKSRDAARHYRQEFSRGGSPPDGAYLLRWIPRPSRTMTTWDGVMTVLGAILLVVAVIALVAAHFWK